MEFVANPQMASHVQHAALQQAEIYVDSDKAHAQLILYADARDIGAEHEVRALGSKVKSHGHERLMGPMFSHTQFSSIWTAARWNYVLIPPSEL